MLAFLAHHGIDANPHDTGLQLHDQILKVKPSLAQSRTPSRIQNQSRKKSKSPKHMPRCQRRRSKMVERMNELIISGNASAKSYAAQMLNLGTRRPTPDEAEAWLACYDDAMADLAQKSEGKDPFNDQF
jgi:truncated hemoglobin YjbI